jgi:hypothetical protein
MNLKSFAKREGIIGERFPGSQQTEDSSVRDFLPDGSLFPVMTLKMTNERWNSSQVSRFYLWLYFVTVGVYYAVQSCVTSR